MASSGGTLEAAALPYVRDIAPYVPGRPIEDLARQIGMEAGRIVKLASNENPLGVPESAVTAMRAALAEVGRYPDGNAHDLRLALSGHLDVAPDWITIGSGSNDILEMAAAVMLAPGRSCVFSQYSFAVYELATQARGARAIRVPARDLGHDLEAMARAVAPDTRLLYLANPNNPTGTLLAPAAIEALLRAVPADVLVVLDEAYNEYLPASERSDTLAWVRRHPNLLVSRTFSKAYGLAGLRVGYGVAQPAVGALLNRVRLPFNVSGVAQAAACAALRDTHFLERSFESNRAGLAQLYAGLQELGLHFIPSHANFILVRVGPAARVNEELLARGIIVRPVANYGLPEWLRVSVGLPAENRRFLEALAPALVAAGARENTA